MRNLQVLVRGRKTVWARVSGKGVGRGYFFLRAIAAPMMIIMTTMAMPA